MPAPLVIEHFEIIEQLRLRFADAVEPIRELALHRGEEALHGRVDAPMCQECCSSSGGHGVASPVIGEEPVVNLTRNEALQAADDVSFAETLSRTAGHVVNRGLMPSHAYGHDAVKGRVGLAMAPAKESVAMRYTARRGNRAHAA